MPNLHNPQYESTSIFFNNEEIDLQTPALQLTSFIKNTRKSLNITQRELSKLSGINQSNLSKIENGLVYPSLVTIQKLAFCLGHKVELHFVPNINQ